MTPPTSGHRHRKREVRRGTFSCWECKHRKIRCEYRHGDEKCTSCQRRGLSCTSQKFYENEYDLDDIGMRVARVERLASELVRQRARPITTNQQSHLPISRIMELHLDLVVKCQLLSGYLHSILPPPQVATLILRRGSSPFQSFRLLEDGTYPHDMNMSTNTTYARSSVHPTTFACVLTRLAICLRHVAAETPETTEFGFAEPLSDVATRFVEQARFVTSQDPLMTAADGLEALLLESCYLIGSGDWMGARKTVRRGFGLSELMKASHRYIPVSRRVDYLCFRLTSAHRVISMKLGLASDIVENCFAVDAEGPTERIERLHAIVAGRIIRRNTLLQNCEQENYSGYTETKSIDLTLRMAARGLPIHWWMLPAFFDTTLEDDMIEESKRLLAQLHQYCHLISLHQPYLLLKSDSDVDYIYSRDVALEASRQLISRFLLLCSIPHASALYLGLEYKAFAAVVSILLAHLQAHSLLITDAIEHHRPQDLSLAFTVIKAMEDMESMYKPKLDISNIPVLKKLAEVEEDAARGAYYTISKTKTCDVSEEPTSLRLCVPYFDSVTIRKQTSFKHSEYRRNSCQIRITEQRLDPVTEFFDTTINPADLDCPP